MRESPALPRDAIEAVERARIKLGSPHFSLPSIESATQFNPADSGDRAALAELGIRVEGDVGDENRVTVTTGGHTLALRFNGARGNHLAFGKNAVIRGQLGFESDENVAVIGDRTSFNNFNATLRVAKSMLLVGSECTSNGVNFGLQGPGNSITVFNDCMLSWGIQLRTTDSHGIFSIDSLEHLNDADSVLIGPHVWIGFDAVIQKGVTVGAGAIIGARSIVNADVPLQCAAAGMPARVVRDRVCWTRSPTPSTEEIKAVMDRFFH